MNFIKKQAAGFYLMLLALILGTAGIVFYVINCNTAYFFKLGISWGVVGYSSDSGGSAFDGRICIFCPPESEQHCDYFII